MRKKVGKSVSCATQSWHARVLRWTEDQFSLPLYGNGEHELCMNYISRSCFVIMESFMLNVTVKKNFEFQEFWLLSYIVGRRYQLIRLYLVNDIYTILALYGPCTIFNFKSMIASFKLYKFTRDPNKMRHTSLK